MIKCMNKEKYRMQNAADAALKELTETLRSASLESVSSQYTYVTRTFVMAINNHCTFCRPSIDQRRKTLKTCIHVHMRFVDIRRKYRAVAHTL